MQCIWQSIARSSLANLGRTHTLFPPARPFASRITSHKKFSCLSTITVNMPRHFTSATMGFSECSSADFASFLPQTPELVRPSRLTLAVTKAVHMSLEEHKFEGAVTIVNTVRYAALPQEICQLKFWQSIKKLPATIPPGVSPRLPAHALIHGLVRHGLFHQASHFAISLMKSHIRVRGKTLECITDGLAKAATDKSAVSKTRDARIKRHMKKLLGDSNVLFVQHHKPSNPNTALALRLWLTARQSESKRTRAMFNTLITLCLINGEIIIASLLFGLLVKDWEQRSNSLTTYCQLEESRKSSFETSKALYMKHVSTQDLRPLPDTLVKLLLPIQKKLEEAIPRDVNDPDFQQALQALAVLGDLLNNRQIPFSRMETLVKALYSCPKVDNWIWVKGTTGAVHVPAYQYFHRTLLYLSQKPPTHCAGPKRTFILRYTPFRGIGIDYWNGVRLIRAFNFTPSHPQARMQPAMTVNSYNALIHYALRHRLSPALAKRIIEHMTIQRVPPISTNKDTLNILLRTSSLYGQNNYVSGLVQNLRLDGTGIVDQDPIMTRAPSIPSNFRVLKEFIDKVRIPSDLTLNQMLHDPFALSTYLSTLASGGRPRVVIQVMRLLLPFFQFHHVRRREQLDKAMRQKWNESVANATKLGPHVLSVFFQALIEGGISREAHTLFALINWASRASQRTRTTGHRWHVPVIMYTQMLEAYRVEHRLCRRRMTPNTEVLSVLFRRVEVLYRAAKDVMSQGPSPMTRFDSRFYNALLKFLVQYLPVKCYSIREARQRYAAIRRQYARTGVVDNRGRVPLLEEVIADMTHAGYSIPLGFHHLFLTDGIGILEGSYKLPELDRHPIAYSESRNITPYTLPVSARKLYPFRLRRRTLISIYKSREVKRYRASM